MDKILDDINRHNKKLLKELDNEEKLLEGIEKLASGIDDKDYLEFLRNAIKPSHDSKKELYQVLTKHKLTSGFKEVIEALDDSIDYSDEVELYEMSHVLKFSNIHRTIKRPVENSGNKRGKRGSFRLLYLANKDIQEICLLHVYPKTGKYGKPQPTKEELILMQKTFLKEAKEKKLEKFEL